MFSFNRFPVKFANGKSDNVIKFKLTEEEKKIEVEKKALEPKAEIEVKKPVKRFEKDSPEAIEWGKMMAEKRKLKKQLKELKEEEQEKKLVMTKIAEQ
jgi:hypothetical protein